MGVSIFDNDSNERDFIFIDDNHPPYQRSPLSKPCRHYVGDAEWEECKLTHFIVSLYNKIHLDAFKAKACINEFILSNFATKLTSKEIHVRTFLTSQRSFKDWMATGDFASNVPELKEYVLSFTMPKFVWIAEISTLEQVSQDRSRATGLVILDATEPNIRDNNALIFACTNVGDRLLFYSHKDQMFKNNRCIFVTL